ncbi:MAG: glycosyltransferase family 9 protein [Thermoanaerobaculales bacterium]
MPAVRRLVDGNHGGETVLHARPQMRRLLAEVFPETLVVASRHRAFPLGSARRLRRGGGRFAVGVTLRHSARAKILMRLTSRWTVGSVGEGAVLLLSRSGHVDRRRHQLFDSDTVLEALGLPGADARWRPALPETLRDEGAAVLGRAGLTSGALVGIAPASARGGAKRWPAENYGRLARKLVDGGLRPVILVGPEEEVIAEEVLAAADSRVPVVGPRLDVAALAGLVAQLRAMVCNDSGPMHLAAFFGTPVVAVFGPTDPSRTGPMGEGNDLLCRRLRCAPCTAFQCPLGHHDCMDRISVEEVEASLLRVLSRD